MNTRHRMLRSLLAAGFAVLTVAPGAAAAPVAGDTYVYQVVNGYNKESRGQVHYKVDKADSSGFTVSVTPDRASAGAQRTEIYTAEGNWLMQPVESHGAKVDYAFAAAYPAYVLPLAAGKSWSLRVDATVAGEPRTRSVRVDGKVLGSERISVLAGSFDTVKIQRLVYAGDPNFYQTETQIRETEWYAPALGRPVRTERRSQWQEPSRCDVMSGCDFYGDWDVIELVAVQPKK